jgi:hypothetical protein
VTQLIKPTTGDLKRAWRRWLDSGIVKRGVLGDGVVPLVDGGVDAVISVSVTGVSVRV